MRSSCLPGKIKAIPAAGNEGAANLADTDTQGKPEAAPAPTGGPAAARRRRGGLPGLFSAVIVLFLAAAAILFMCGFQVRLPVWAVAEAERRLNAALVDHAGDLALALGGLEVGLEPGGNLRLRLEDARLLHRNGAPAMTIPETVLSLDGPSLLRGTIRPNRLAVVGADLSLKRRPDGQLDILLEGAAFARPITGIADVFEEIDRALAQPMLKGLASIEADAFSLTFADSLTGHVWRLGDGRLRLENGATDLRAEVAMTLLSDKPSPALVQMTVIAEKGDAAARISANVDQVPAGDLALLVPPLAPLALLAAPISGSLAASFGDDGITALDAALDIGAGALAPTPASVPIPFDRAGMTVNYDPLRGRVNLTSFDVQSKTLRLRASGHSYLTDAEGAILTGPLGALLPSAFLSQIRIDEMQVDPEGLFRRPVRFSEGAIDIRLLLDPFRLDIGQVSLVEADRRLTARGMIGADARGWQSSIDIFLDRIGHSDLLALWPVTLVPRTREWLEENVLEGRLTDVKAALRIAPDREPVLSLGYDFRNADVRFIRTLPPIRQADGYATIEGQTYTMVVSRGEVIPPLGGRIDMSGTVFSVLDITRRPAQAEVELRTSSSLTAALSLLNEPPFEFLSKAGRPVEIGDGTALLNATLRFPLAPRITANDVSFRVEGEVRDFSSDRLIPGKTVTSPFLTLGADPRGLRVSGSGLVGAVPFDVSFLQPFGPDAPAARIEGTVELSRRLIDEFRIGLPPALADGTGQGSVTITLPKGAPAQLELVSDLARLDLALPGTGWRKTPAQTGRLALRATLGSPARIDSLSLTAPGLDAQGTVTLSPTGGLERASFDRVILGDWMRGQVVVTGRGAGRPVAIAVTGGTADLRRRPQTDAAAETSRATAEGGDIPLAISLDRLRITETIALTNFRGNFSPRGGFNGTFSALVNEGAAITGTVVPAANGTAVRIRSDNAGGVLASAGVFRSARGGELDLVLQPRATTGVYDGRADIRNIRVVNAPVLAELLNAVSVVGLLEQLNGEGLLFADATGDFLLTPGAVEIRRGSAVGASLGVTMAGVYGTENGRLALQGVVSPIYMLNGIGSLITRRGEGLFGFNYEVRGTSDRALVSVNPLSILTPGMFRDLFRRNPPTLGNPDG